MNEISLREKAVLAVLGVVAMYALAVGLWFLSQEAAWKKAQKRYEKALDTYNAECRLIAEKSKWTEAYDEEKAAMPTFEPGKATDTTWLKKMDDLAEKYHIAIAQRQSGRETESGEVLELPIEVKSWEGSLESLVKFMHELENTTEGMFDIRSLNLKPSGKKGYLKGSFVLTCAYMREG
ncbi:MAG: hypothetical protein II909_01155 [Kiritimatiellae bacterium]|nr:hypothetical protein [Kiritimatiellia bacterium]